MNAKFTSGIAPEILSIYRLADIVPSISYYGNIGDHFAGEQVQTCSQRIQLAMSREVAALAASQSTMACLPPDLFWLNFDPYLKLQIYFKRK